jgi:hypothetical protein
MNLKEHADNLAAQVVALLKVTPSYHDAQAKTAETALQEYRDACSVEWVKASATCEALLIAPRTLVRWRQEDKIKEGTHWQRLGLSGHCVYNVPAITKLMGPAIPPALPARCPV